MAITSAGLQIPARCKFCGAVTTVVPVTTIMRGVVRQTWCCRSCGSEWLITAREQQLMERREERTDRRRMTRNDRRGK